MDIVGHWLHFGNNSVNAVLVLTPNFRKGGRGLEGGVSPFHNFSHKKTDIAVQAISGTGEIIGVGVY